MRHVSCEFERVGDRMVCRHCGQWLLYIEGVGVYRAICRVADNGSRTPAPVVQPVAAKQQPIRVERANGLGDYTEQVLSTIGVTPGRYVAAKELFGLAPNCNCAARKEWLNKVGDWWASA